MSLTVMDSIDVDGFSMVEDLLSEAAVDGLIHFIECEMESGEHRGGVRNLLDLPAMRELARERTIREYVEAVLGAGARPVRGILFDKTEKANWKVPWHQDVTIAVRARVEADGYGPWSVKAGVVHVQPPAEVLERMVSVRLHLDDCPAENGALRVIAGSHVAGKLAERTIQEIAQDSLAVTCTMRRGGALMMRPLLIHSSSASVVPGHRRVIHFDYANVDLALGMDWAAEFA